MFYSLKVDKIIMISDFCKNLARKEGDNVSSSEEEGEITVPNADEEQPFINHPFKVRDASSIVLNIRVSCIALLLFASHEFRETCHSVTFIVLVNSHQR